MDFHPLSQRPVHRDHDGLRPSEIVSTEVEARRLGNRESDPGVAVHIARDDIWPGIIFHDHVPAVHRVFQDLYVDIACLRRSPANRFQDALQ